jgi:hypothetical protein
MQFSTLLSALGLATLISAQDGSTSYYVSDCDGVTNAAWYTGSLNAGVQCIPWTDGNIEYTQIASDADGFTCERKFLVFSEYNVHFANTT